MKQLSLKEVIECTNGTTTMAVQGYINGVSTDTRENLKGKLFIALRGKNFDGHDFINKALEAGAVAVVADKNINCSRLIKVANTKQALIDIATYYRSLFNVKVIGITGSVGKTTTKDMVASVVGKKYKILKTEQNLNNEIGVSKTILNLHEGIDVAIIEMGMCNSGEILEISNIIKPNIGVVTNIGVSHIESLKTRENIFKAKMEIIGGMKKGSTLILNKDVDFFNSYSNKGYNVKFYSIKSENVDVFANNINYNLEKTNFDIVDDSLKIKVELPCLGEHSVYSALVAYIIGRQLAISVDDILEGLKLYKPSGMRQKIVNFNGIKFVEDCYNASPDSMKAAIETISRITVSGRKIMVISDMLELGCIANKEHYKIGQLIAKSAVDKVYCFGDFAKQYVDGAIENGMNKRDIEIFPGKIELEKKLNAEINSGDIVWFKASRGMKLEEVIEKIYKNKE